MDNYKYILEDMLMNVRGYDKNGYKHKYLYNEFIALVIKVTGISNYYDAVDYLIEKKDFNL